MENINEKYFSYIAKAEAALTKGFKTAAAQKDALQAVSDAFEIVYRQIHNKLLQTPYEQRNVAWEEVYYNVPCYPHLFNQKAEDRLHQFPDEVCLMKQCKQLRDQIKAAEVVKQEKMTKAEKYFAEHEAQIKKLQFHMDMTKIDSFLSDLCKKTKDYYQRLRSEYQTSEAETFQDIDCGRYIRSNQDKKDYCFKRTYGAEALVIAKKANINIDQLLRDKAQTMKDHLIITICEKVGEVIDIQNLHVSKDGSINCTIINKNGEKFRVQTAGAGGYNIQKFHFRVLVNKIK